MKGCVCVRVCVCVCVRACVHASVHTCACVCVSICICTTCLLLLTGATGDIVLGICIQHCQCLLTRLLYPTVVQRISGVWVWRRISRVSISTWLIQALLIHTVCIWTSQNAMYFRATLIWLAFFLRCYCLWITAMVLHNTDFTMWARCIISMVGTMLEVVFLELIIINWQ